MPPKIAFIPADATGKTTAKDRKVIRSHCMLGKNQRKYPYHGNKIFREGKETRARKSGPQFETIVWQANAADYPVHPSPIRMPSLFWSATFARDIDAFSRNLLCKYFFVARDVFYPIQFCTYSDASSITWFRWLINDVAYLESCLMGVSALDDLYHGRLQPSRLTYSYLKETIMALNRRLSDPALSLSDSTIAVVMGLADLSGFLSDEAAAMAHVAGFQQMVRLRGGISAFSGNTKLQIKIGRFDLAHSLKTGNPPQFYQEPIFDSPLVGPVKPAAASMPSSQCSDSFIVCTKLRSILHDLVQFTTILNASCSISSRSAPQPTLMDTQYQNIINSIQYRLLCLENRLATILDEAARLGMLALLTSTFQVAGQRAKYPYLEARFRTFCRALRPTTGNRLSSHGEEAEGNSNWPALAPPEVVLWLLLMGALAVFDVHPSGQRRKIGAGNEVMSYGSSQSTIVDDKWWMVEVWRHHIPVAWWSGWDKAKDNLKGFPWIEVIHDRRGRDVFEVLCTGARSLQVDHASLCPKWDSVVALMDSSPRFNLSPP